MRARAVLREAWRNVRTGTTRAALWCCVLTAVAGVALALDAAAILRLERRAEEFQAAGASILTVVAADRVDGTLCEGLGGLPGIRAAGAIAIASDEQVTAAALPGAPIALARTTPGFPAVLGADHDQAGGLILPRETVELLGLKIGDPFVTTASVTRLSGTYHYPRDGRRDSYGYLALEPVDRQAVFDECWVDAWPTRPELGSLLLLTVLPSGGAEQGREVWTSRG